jgi:hypothetical protein
MTAPNTTAEDPRIVEPQYHAARLHALIISLRNLAPSEIKLGLDRRMMPPTLRAHPVCMPVRFGRFL